MPKPKKITAKNVGELAKALRKKFNEKHGRKWFQKIYYGHGGDVTKDGLNNHPAIQGMFNLEAHMPLNLYFLSRAMKKPTQAKEAWALFLKLAIKRDEGTKKKHKPNFHAIHTVIEDSLQQNELVKSHLKYSKLEPPA